MFTRITSRQNEIIKTLNRLKSKKNRDQENLFVFEGSKLFLEALNWNIEITAIFITSSFLQEADHNISEAIKFFKKAFIPIYLLEDSVFALISSMKMPEGILCSAKKIKKEKKICETYVILDDIQDPGNVGTIIRTADASGFDRIICSDKTADIYNEKVLRGSMGSVFHLPIEQVLDLEKRIYELKSEGITIIGTSLKGQSQLFLENQNPSSFGLVLGNESKGMSTKIENLCDTLYKLPMVGHAESLNVSVAAGILMYTLTGMLNK
ncbi:MAG: RNA methyltransferase [Eubacterium sp.]